MSYLLIRKNDVKVFKSFLSGNEIEVGVVVNQQASAFDTGDVVEVFYGQDDHDTYTAQVTRQKKIEYQNTDRSLVMLGLVRKNG